MSYLIVVKTCRVLANTPGTPPATARVLLLAAKMIEEQALRCMELAVKLERVPF